MNTISKNVVNIDRRRVLTAVAGAAVTPFISRLASAQETMSLEAITSAPTSRDWSGQNPIRYPDPDVIALDERFNQYIVGNTTIQKLYSGSLWSEGPAWNGVGRYLVWSDIPNNLQRRWIEDDGRVAVFRHPSGNSNGNTFDFSGRQLSCEHGGRRVARYETDGTVTTIADQYNGNRLNSPNDVVVHPDGGIWFTDPPYGIRRSQYEGFYAESETKPAVYRVDGETGQIAMVTDEVVGPNGLCFSPDYSLLYVADTGSRPREIKVWDVDGTTLRNGREFAQINVPNAGADGIRCDIKGRVWSSAGDGVHIFSVDGGLVGKILVPEAPANLCFGSETMQTLFITARTSLYSIRVKAEGVR